MDFIKELGPLALGSRLRRLSDLLMKDVAQVYELQNLNFEPRWFTMFFLLKNHSPMAVTEIAEALGVTHPAIIQVARDMKRRGLVVSQQNPHDKRIRNIGLSDKGRALLPKLEPIWKDIAASAEELIKDSDCDLMAIIEKLEQISAQKSVYDRVLEKVRSRQQETVKILDYSAKHKAYFRSLNEEWLTKFFTLEPLDEELLSEPQKHILDKGGFIWFAEIDQEIIGTCALIKVDKHIFELGKMAVTEKAQGKQAGKQLALAALKKARDMKAKRIVLESNTKLETAIRLYRQLGFVETKSPHPSEYQRTDIFMSLELK